MSKDKKVLGILMSIYILDPELKDFCFICLSLFQVWMNTVDNECFDARGYGFDSTGSQRDFFSKVAPSFWCQPTINY